MKILYIGAEVVPFASTGGLGDVLGSLPVSLAKADKGADVRVIMPMHSKIQSEYREKMEMVTEFTVSLAWRRLYCGVWQYKKNGVTYYFIDNEYYFKRIKLYGEYDDGERYAFFCRAVLETLAKINFIPDILHANDWHSALAVIYQKLVYRYEGVKCVYTIHNIEYQGMYDMAILGDVFALGNEYESIMKYNGCINLTKAAIVCCDRLTTVSSKYMDEIKTPEYSHGLHYIINDNAYKSSGIVNGIDYVLYDPLHDKSIAANYSAARPSGKAKCKEALQNKLGLDTANGAPIIAMITRLASHKGVDLVIHVADEIVALGAELVILGTGMAEYEDFFRGLEARHKNRVRALIEFNKNTAKEIYSGADLFLMPSKSEPCGLSQMIASRYGTPAIVRFTGGLADTIIPYDHTDKSGNGINFHSYDAYDMLDAVRRAIEIYKDGANMKALRKNAMNTDFSWSASAHKYIELYKGI